MEQGLKILGFAEHSAFPDNRYGNTRMAYDQLEFYRQEIEEAEKNVMAACSVLSSGVLLSVASKSSMSPYFIINYTEGGE